MTALHLSSTSRTSRRPPRTPRAGSVTIEFLVVLPVLVISILAVVQFGYYFQRCEQVILATRSGAEEASLAVALAAGPGPVPVDIENAVRRQLQSSGISTVTIIVEHNEAGPTETLRTNYVANAISPPATPLPPLSVRVTVGVPLPDLMPNSLGAFGFDISSRHTVYSATYDFTP